MKQILFLIVCTLSLAGLAQGQTPVPTVTPASRPWVSAYYLAGDADNGRLPPSKIDFSAFSHLMVAGLSIQADGTINPLKCGITQAESKLAVTAAHAAGVKAIVLVGGDTNGSIVQSALSAEHRATLARSLVQFAITYGYDGIDIDFEPIDDTNVPDFEKFIPELRANMMAADPRLLLTAAVATEPQMFARLQVQFDQINIMTYDLSGPWEGFKSWYNASLYGAGTKTMNAKDPYPSADSMVAQYTAAGVSKSKLGIGLAFYGYVWSRITGPQQDIKNLTEKDVNDSVDYDVIMDTYYQPQRYHWDNQAKAPYLSIDAPDPKNRKFISYDDATLCAAKLAYVKQQGLGGVIIWQISGGYRASQPEGQQDALLQAVKKAWLAP
jgi:chitinase